MLQRSISTLGLALALAGAASAATYVILPDGTGDYATIQAAIDAAAPGDVIELADGIFSGPGNRDLDFGGKALTVRSQSLDPNTCMIDGGGVARGFHFHSGEGADALVEGILITNGYAATGGGGIYCEVYTSPTIRNCALIGNRASGGGAMWLYNHCDPQVIDCTFSGNTITGQNGGGLLIGLSSAPSFENCLIFSNASTAFGGGALCYTGSSPEFTGCSFIDNTAGVTGGGVYCGWDSDPTFTSCVFQGNTASLGGGAVRCYEDSDVVLVSCTLVGNGGAYGGGVYCTDGSHPVLENTIIAFSTEGEGLCCGGGASATLTCCDIYGNPDGDWVGCIAMLLGVDGNIADDPMLCNPDDRNLNLQEDSPCAPDNNPDCGLVGALPVGCEPMDVPHPWDIRDGALIVYASPNPFSQQTRLTYHVPSESHAGVTLSVYDPSGRLVRTLVQQHMPAGTHTVAWDGTDRWGNAVQAGIYFYQLSLDKRTTTRRVVYVR